MKALTLYRPWPWAIFHAPRNPKRVENRPWKPWPSVVGQVIALHAGRKFDSDAADRLCVRYGLHPDGRPPAGWEDEGLIGTAMVLGYATSAEDCTRYMAGQAAWWIGPFAWLLADVRAFATPIPCAGALGLWDVPAHLVKRFRYAA